MPAEAGAALTNMVLRRRMINPTPQNLLIAFFIDFYFSPLAFQLFL
jgi:hypothetical protein